MATDDEIRDEKLQYDIDRDISEISALSSGKIDKYEYLTDKEVPPLGKAIEKQTKTIEDQANNKLKL